MRGNYLAARQAPGLVAITPESLRVETQLASIVSSMEMLLASLKYLAIRRMLTTSEASNGPGKTLVKRPLWIG